MRPLVILTLLCTGAVAVLMASPPQRPAGAKPAVRVVVDRRTVTKRLPRHVKVKHVYVDVPAPPVPAAPVRSAAVYTPPAAPVVRPRPPATYRPAASPLSAPKPRPTQTSAPPTDANSVHQWEEIHHRDAPNHDQLEHQGQGDG